MKLLAISEHYFPRVGGTVSYVHETLTALSKLGVEAELLVPGRHPEGWQSGQMRELPYRVTWMDVGYPTQGNPDRQTRYRFCRRVNEVAQSRARSVNAPDLVHVVFGLFVMELLETEKLREKGLRSVATVHNVPPHECRTVSPYASVLAKIKEELRLHMVKRKNHARITAHSYDAIVVPSDQVLSLVTPLLPKQTPDVIGHGPTADLVGLMSPPNCRRPAQRKPLRLLTAGGYAPHKRQHLIPMIAQLLCDRGLEIEWDVVGPSGRVAGYFDRIVRTVNRTTLEKRVRLQSSVSVHELAGLYDAANLYVQPSIEEGFCITALDAAAAGLPVIASPAGALARIAQASSGLLAESSPWPLAGAIMKFVRDDRWGDARESARNVREQFSWDMAAAALRNRYEAILRKDAYQNA
ncbi:MAG: glycosyltransferase family 4 protein [Pseudomonadota bacterium]